ncbi:MAG: c-type cytochrome [Gammaproteobacteria bacterium]|nr:c-type cytochrome [Gammaproteobacteria bacterium]
MQSYTVYCKACHESAVSGAPITHRQADWRPRISKGWKRLTDNTENGIGGMPPLGQCFECSREDLEILIQFMASPND